MAKIVVSYRRTDSSAVSRLLRSELRAHYIPIYGEDAVYMDVEDERNARDFHVQFNQEVEHGGVMLAVVGPNWLGSPKGTRIMEADDPIRIELETASRRGITIIPVLVEGAGMPKAEKLPPELAYLTRFKAPQVDSRGLISISRCVG